MKTERKKVFTQQHREQTQLLTRAIADYEGYKAKTPASELPQAGKADLEARLEQLKALESAIEDVGPIYDVVLFKEAQSQKWKISIDTTETGDFSSAKLMGEYRENYEFSTFSDADMMNYSFNVYDEGSPCDSIVRVRFQELILVCLPQAPSLLLPMPDLMERMSLVLLVPTIQISLSLMESHLAAKSSESKLATLELAQWRQEPPWFARLSHADNVELI